MLTVRASGGHEWYYCHGSQLLQDGLPNDDTVATREGTAVHWLAVQIIIPYIKSNMSLVTDDDFVDTLAPNDVLITKEMYQAAVDYVTDILGYCNKTGLMQSVHVEETLNIDTIYPGMVGTPDAWIYNPLKLELILWDLKFGYGEVAAFDNPQLMIYVAAILVFLKIDGISDQNITVKMRIVQPRSYHSNAPIKEWIVKASDLRPYFNRLRTAAIETMSGKGVCVPGTHCRYCRGRFRCSALQKTVYNAIDVTTGPVYVGLKGNNLALEYKLLKHASKLLEYRLNGIEAEVESEIKGGTTLPGFRLTETYGRERWKKSTPIKQVLMMSDAMGVDIRKPDNVDTPKQALTKFMKKAKELKVTLDDSVIRQYTETPFTGHKVIEDDGSYIREAFRKD